MDVHQFQVSNPDGLIVERLPVGFAAGRLWITFVCSGVNFFGPERLATSDGGFHREFAERVRISTLEGDNPGSLGGGAGGGDSCQNVTAQIDPAVDFLAVTYLQAGVVVAAEHIDVRRLGR